MIRWICFLLCLGIAGLAPAQPTWTFGSPFPVSVSYFADMHDPPFAQLIVRPKDGIPQAISGAPYSVEIHRTLEEKLPDGTEAGSPPVERVYRDAAGRIRYDVTLTRKAAQLTMTHILDPVRHFYYLLDSQQKVAYRVKYDGPDPEPMKVPEVRRNAASIVTVTLPDGSKQITESLGTRAFDDVLADGKRTTRTFPLDASGKPVRTTEVNESWTAPRLMMTVQSDTTGQGPHSHLEMTNFRVANPPPELFLVPLDYRIEDRPASFDVAFGSRQRLDDISRSTQVESVAFIGSNTSRDGDASLANARVMPLRMQVVEGAPFSGVQFNHNLKPGLRVPFGGPVLKYRDWRGRTRYEHPMQTMRPNPDGPQYRIPSNLPKPTPWPTADSGQRPGDWIAEVNDPVEGYFYLLTFWDKTAYRIKYDPNGELPTGLIIPVPPPEPLGRKTINGLEVEGRIETVPLAGVRIQVWREPRTGITLETDELIGNEPKLNVEMREFSLANPDPALFRPPQGWQVRDVPDTFTLPWGPELPVSR